MLLSLIKIFSLLILIDAAWLYFMLPTYKSALTDLIATNFKPLAGLLFYVIYSLAIYGLVITASESVWQAILKGALLGIAAYGAYDLTNLAFLKNFPVWLAVVDMAWGSFLTACVSGVVYYLNHR